MTIVLLILKCIGILLATIILLLLFLCLLVLFAPIHYSTCIIYEQEYKFNYLFRWCFCLLTIKKTMNSDLVKMYLFGIPIWTIIGERNISDELEKDIKKMGEPLADKEMKKSSQTSSKKKIKKSVKNKTSKKSKQNFKKKKRKNPLFPFRKISSIIKFARNKENKKVFSMLWKELKWILRYVKPKKLKGKLYFGTDNPSSTGLLLGGISLFPVAYTKGLAIIPDFEQKVFCANVEIGGRIQLYYLAKLAWRLYRSKELKLTIKRWNNL